MKKIIDLGKVMDNLENYHGCPFEVEMPELNTLIIRPKDKHVGLLGEITDEHVLKGHDLTVSFTKTKPDLQQLMADLIVLNEKLALCVHVFHQDKAEFTVLDEQTIRDCIVVPDKKVPINNHAEFTIDNLKDALLDCVNHTLDFDERNGLNYYLKTIMKPCYQYNVLRYGIYDQVHVSDWLTKGVSMMVDMSCFLPDFNFEEYEYKTIIDLQHIFLKKFNHESDFTNYICDVWDNYSMFMQSVLFELLFDLIKPLNLLDKNAYQAYILQSYQAVNSSNCANRLEREINACKDYFTQGKSR